MRVAPRASTAASMSGTHAGDHCARRRQPVRRPIHGCEECRGTTGASDAQTDQWLSALVVTAAAVALAWLVATAVISHPK
jgi:hypothetical protein